MLLLFFAGIQSSPAPEAAAHSCLAPSEQLSRLEADVGMSALTSSGQGQPLNQALAGQLRLPARSGVSHRVFTVPEKHTLSSESEAWLCGPTLLLPGSVTLGRSLHLFEPHFFGCKVETRMPLPRLPRECYLEECASLCLARAGPVGVTALFSELRGRVRFSADYFRSLRMSHTSRSRRRGMFQQDLKLTCHLPQEALPDCSYIISS